MTFKFIHAADIHLDSPLRGLERYEGAPIEEIRGATRQALENLVALAIEEGVAFVLIVGDLYDGDWKDYNTPLFFNKQMSRLRREDIQVFVVAGNHDADSRLTKQLSTMKNVTFLSTRKVETVVLEKHGVAIHGRGYPKRKVTDDISAAYPKAQKGLFNIGLLHTAVDGRVGHEPYAPCTVEGLCDKGYQYWALGHVHSREILHAEPWIVFPGCIQGRHVRETGPKGCELITVEEGEVQAVEHRDLDVLRWAMCEVDVTGSETADEAVGLVHKELKRLREECEDRFLAARVVQKGECAAHGEITGDIEHHRSEIRSGANDLGDVWVEKIRVETRMPVNLDELRGDDHPVGRLICGIEEIGESPEKLKTLAYELADLQKKLPPELRGGDDPLDLEDAETICGMLQDVKNLLVGRLLAEGGQR